MLITGLVRLAAACLTLALFNSPAFGQVRSLTVRDVVSMSSFGSATLDPSGRRIVYERRGPYDTAQAFDLGHRSIWGLNELWIASVDGEGVPERLLPEREGPGLLMGAWSPAGGRLLVYRLRQGRLEAGVVEMSDRTVWWTGLAPDLPFTGSGAEWLDDDRLGLTVFPDGELPWMLRYYGGSQIETIRQWDRTTGGQVPGRTVIDTDDGAASAEVPGRQRDLVVLDVPRRTGRVIAEGQIRDWTVSPDRKRVAVLQAGAPVPILPDAVRQMGMPDRGRLSLIDLVDGTSRSGAAGLDVAPHLLRWSPDSSELLIWARQDDQVWAQGELIRVQKDGDSRIAGRADIEGVGPGADIDLLSGVRADWIGDVPVLHGWRDTTQRFDWYVLRQEGGPKAITSDLVTVPNRLSAIGASTALLFADNALWVAGPAGTSRLANGRSLAEAIPADRMKPVRLRVNAAPRQSWAMGMDQSGRLVTVEEGGRETVLEIREGSGESTVLAASQGAAVIVTREQGMETLRLSTANRTRVLDTVNPGFAALAYARPVALPHLDASGEDTRSWLFLPPGRAPSAAKGVVVLAYPGAVDDGRYVSPSTLLNGPRAALIAAEGYAVLSPSIPVGRSGSGAVAAFERSLDLAVEAMQRAQPDLPKDRMALLGHSFGGYLAVAVASRSSRYQTYIAWAPATDMAGIWGEFTPVSRVLPEEAFTLRQQMGWAEVNQGGLNGPPWADPAAYQAASPYQTASRITDPILLITADRDQVPMSQAERIFSVVNRQGGRARLVTYWGEGHTNVSPANILDVYSQIFGWLELTLSGLAITASIPDGPPTPEPNPRRPPRS